MSRLVHRDGRELRPFSSAASVGCVGAATGGVERLPPPNVATICATFASIVFSVATTLVMRWPVMSWKLHAS